MTITAVVTGKARGDGVWPLITSLLSMPAVASIICLTRDRFPHDEPKVQTITSPPGSTETFDRLLPLITTDYLWWIDTSRCAGISPDAATRCLTVAKEAAVAVIYGDYEEYGVTDYEPGSIRDTFDFGPFFFVSREAVVRARERSGFSALQYGAWYDIRLRLAQEGAFVHLREPLGKRGNQGSADEEMFAYVDPRHRTYEQEMEQVATAHLQRIGAYLPPIYAPLPADPATYPVEASIVIPVRNRITTIGAAVDSALNQVTGFPSNVIVIDNHSTDGTTDLLEAWARHEERLLILRPVRRDLRIGGCWNLALNDPHCGRFAVQLDSDDLYARSDAVKLLVDLLKNDECGMAIGAYTLVDDEGGEIPRD